MVSTCQLQVPTNYQDVTQGRYYDAYNAGAMRNLFPDSSADQQTWNCIPLWCSFPYSTETNELVVHCWLSQSVVCGSDLGNRSARWALPFLLWSALAD